MSPERTDEQVKDAILHTRIITQIDNIHYLAHGMEGALSTDGTRVYKYFYKGQENFNPGQLDFIRTKVLKKRFKHITYLEDIIETDHEVIFQIELKDGTEYSGGYLDQIRELLIELKENGVGYRNICPKNMIVSKGQVVLCDLGHSFVELNDHEFLVMMKRAYLSYKFHFREDLPELMRKAIDKDIPELFEFRYFHRTIEPKLTTIPKDRGAILNPFSTFSMETENFKRILPSEANFQKEFNYLLIEKQTGEEKTITHLPFEMLERSYMQNGLSICHIKEISSTDFQLLSPGNDFIDVQIKEIKKPRLHDVNLLIKASPIEWETIDFQIKHIIKQLNTPQQFSEVVVVTDTHKGPFLRQYAEPNHEILLEKLHKLLEDGWIDRIEVAPHDEKAILQEYGKWFSLRSLHTHASNGQHLYTSLYGIGQCNGKYILQLDSDCIIVRKDFNHDYLTEMVKLLEDNPTAISIPFAVGSEGKSTEESTGLESWRTEVRFSLIDKERLMQLLPLPNELDKNGKLIHPWHRALDKKVQESKMATHRRSNPDTFFTHIQNETKCDVNIWYNILKTAEKGRIPLEQYGNVDLIPNIGLWLGTKAEKYVFLIRGQNVELPKLRRMFETVEEQPNQDWGCVFIDAGSKNGMEEYIDNIILPEHPDKVTFFRNWRPLTPLENTCIGISQLISNPETVVITLDADDALVGDKVLDILESYYRKGADLTVGTMLRTDKHKEYPVDFKTPRETNGGNIWQHLRTFKKYLFDSIPIEYFKMDGEWIPHTEDWAFMLPMIDIAKSPVHIKERLYFYEPSLNKSRRKLSEREEIIAEVINKPRLSTPIIPLTSPEPYYPSSLDLIEIDITYACNLKCNNCNRSCKQAPSNEHMTITQIQKFIKQSIESGHRFKRIRILGGEPLIHPDIIEILNVLVDYCEIESPETIIEVSTNGYGEKVKETINSIPSQINIINTYKTIPEIENFEPFNLAPRDLTDFSQKDYENACWITQECGIGLNQYGYYHCAVAAGIDRVIGLDIGLKELPKTENEFNNQKRKLCRYCGHFLNRKKVHTKNRSKIYGQQITKSWKIAYERYEHCKQLLSEY